MKKAIAFSLTILLIFSLIVTPANAQVKTTDIANIELEYSIDSLENGVEVKCYYDTDGNIYVNPNDSQISTNSLIDLITFSVKLKKVTTTEGYLTWTITLSPGEGGLTKVTGYMYCKSFSSLIKPYAYQVISSGRLPGTVLSTSGSGSHFALPKSGTLVKVGWENVLVYTISDAASLRNVWSAVTI